jgi:site-specific DNA recombinase
MTAQRRRRPTPADPQRAIGYIRVSTDEQTLGPEAQRTALATWCARHGCTLVAVHTDQGVSGGAELDKRPGLLAALADVRTHHAGLLLVAKRDRLARDTILAGMIERLVEREGAAVRTTDGTTDGDGPEGMLMRRIVDAFAEYERLLIQARTRAALAVKRTRGERIGDIPYGYGLAADRVHLEPRADEQETRRLIEGYRRAGLTLRAIGARLAARGILPRSGGRWHPQTVANVLARVAI